MKRYVNILPLFLALLLLLTAGCTNNPPVIRDVWWMPVTVENREEGRVHRELMLYVQVEDGEGPADLARIELERTGESLLWKADPSLWKERREGEVLWVGSSRIVSFGDALEEGDYLLTVEDRGGRTDQIPLSLTGWPGKEELGRHRILRSGNEFTISSPSAGWFLLPQTGEGERDEGKLKSLPANQPFSMEDYLSGGGEFYLMLFERNRMALIKEGPYTYLSAE